MKAKAVVIAMFMALLSGCISGIPVNIDNRSATQLTNVVVSGKGFSESVGSIAAGGKAQVRVRPRVATTVKVAFEAAGRRFSATTAEDLENDNGYTVEAIVDPEFSIAIAPSLR